VKRTSVGLLALLAAGLLVAAPVSAAKRHAARHAGPTCKQIKDAIASGKSADDVAKDMKVSATRVKNCTEPAPHAKKSTKKAM
jgi:hypothetical protein